MNAIHNCICRVNGTDTDWPVNTFSPSGRRRKVNKPSGPNDPSASGSVGWASRVRVKSDVALSFRITPVSGGMRCTSADFPSLGRQTPLETRMLPAIPVKPSAETVKCAARSHSIGRLGISDLTSVHPARPSMLLTVICPRINAASPVSSVSLPRNVQSAEMPSTNNDRSGVTCQENWCPVRTAADPSHTVPDTASTGKGECKKRSANCAGSVETSAMAYASIPNSVSDTIALRVRPFRQENNDVS